MAIDRALLAQQLRRVSGVKKADTTLPTLPPATPIEATEGRGTEGATAAQGGGAGLTLGDATTVSVTTTDGLFTVQFPARTAVLADGSTVAILVGA